MVGHSTRKGGEGMATKMPQITGYVPEEIKREIQNLEQYGLKESRIVAFCAMRGLPEIREAVKKASGGIVALPMPKHLKPSSK